MNDNDIFISLCYDFNTTINVTAITYALKTLKYQYFMYKSAKKFLIMSNITLYSDFLSLPIKSLTLSLTGLSSNKTL